MVDNEHRERPEIWVARYGVVVPFWLVHAVSNCVEPRPRSELRSAVLRAAAGHHVVRPRVLVACVGGAGLPEYHGHGGGLRIHSQTCRALCTCVDAPRRLLLHRWFTEGGRAVRGGKYNSVLGVTFAMFTSESNHHWAVVRLRACH
jgi:hypothetical protein